MYRLKFSLNRDRNHLIHTVAVPIVKVLCLILKSNLIPPTLKRDYQLVQAQIDFDESGILAKSMSNGCSTLRFEIVIAEVKFSQAASIVYHLSNCSRSTITDLVV